MPYCGCAGDRLTAGVWPALLAVALWGLVHVEWMVADGGLHPTVVLWCCWVLVWMWVGVWMWMGVWSCEFSWDSILGRGGELGWWVSLGHGWIRGCRCVLVTLYGQRDSFFNLKDHFHIPSVEIGDLLTSCMPSLNIICFSVGWQPWARLLDRFMTLTQRRNPEDTGDPLTVSNIPVPLLWSGHSTSSRCTHYDRRREGSLWQSVKSNKVCIKRRWGGWGDQTPDTNTGLPPRRPLFASRVQPQLNIALF